MVAAPTRTNSNGAGALPQVELYLLGTPRIVVDGAPRRLPYEKATALLAYLVVTARPHSREALATLLWDSANERQAQNSLRNALYVVRRDLKPAAPLAVTRRQVSVEGTGLWLDVDCFKRSVRGKEETVASLADALALWRGPFLDGLSVEGAADFNTWVSSTQEQLSRFYQDGWLALSHAYEKIEQWYQALDATLQVLTLDPLYEAGHRQVMRLHLRMGNRAAALQQYEKCRNLLIEELGVVPDARTRSLHEQALAERPLFKRGRSPIPQTEGQSVFIGRQQELAALDEHLRTVVREARGRLVLVEGEAGIGKTRLVNEWLGSLRHIHVLSGRCFEAEQGVPYHPWIDLLRNSLEHRDWQRLKLSDLWRAELSQLIPELRTMYPDLPSPVALDPELARGRLAEAVHQWLRILGQQKAVCLFLDDLQWIDRASLALLEYLLRHSVALSLMIVGTQREREMDPHWQRTESRLAREGACHRLSLFRLSFSEVAAIAYHFGFRAADPDAFLTRLFRETEGNPLFVVEILRSLQTMDVDPSGPWSIPPTVKGVVQSHLNRLSTRTRQMLTVAAVIGRTFNHTALEAVTGQPLELVLSVLDEGIATGLIVEQDGRYDFSHDKIRAVLYNAVSRARRQHLHRRIAEALESLYAGDLSPFFGLLAQHLEAAGEAHLARRYALQAAKRAVELYADEDALSWYDRAQALSEIVPTELDPGAIPQVIPFHQLFVSSASPLDVPGLVYRQQGLIHQRRGRYEMARQNFELALARAIKRQRLDEQAAAHGLLSYLAYLRGDYDELARQAQRSLELATRTGKVALQAEGVRDLGIAAYRTGDYQRAIELYCQSLSASRSINDRAGMAKCHNNIGFALRTLQQFDASVASYQRALELHEATGSIEGAALVLANIGGVYAHSGNLEQALVYLERAFTLSDESHADWITARVCRTMGGIYLRNGQRHQALAAAERARDLAQTLGSKEDLGAAYRLLGEITAAWPESGLGAADDYFDKSVSILRQVGEQYELTRALSSLEAYRRTRG